MRGEATHRRPSRSPALPRTPRALAAPVAAAVAVEQDSLAQRSPLPPMAAPGLPTTHLGWVQGSLHRRPHPAAARAPQAASSRCRERQKPPPAAPNPGQADPVQRTGRAQRRPEKTVTPWAKAALDRHIPLPARAGSNHPPAELRRAKGLDHPPMATGSREGEAPSQSPEAADTRALALAMRFPGPARPARLGAASLRPMARQAQAVAVPPARAVSTLPSRGWRRRRPHSAHNAPTRLKFSADRERP